MCGLFFRETHETAFTPYSIDPPRAFPTPDHESSDVRGSKPGVTDVTVPATVPATGPETTNGNTPTLYRFEDLPAAVRRKIWRLSFVPRVVEVHRRKMHYADVADGLGWQSWSANPTALSVCIEARRCALRHYTAAVRLAANTPCELAGSVRTDATRKLYFAPSTDTLAMLGDFNVAQTTDLLRVLSAGTNKADGGPGLRLAVCASSLGQASLLLVYGRTIFRDLEQLTLFMYSRREPPTGWADGVCALVDCHTTYQYRRFLAEQAAGLRVVRGLGLDPGLDDDDRWVSIGRNPLRVRDLVFGAGAALTDEAVPASSHDAAAIARRAANPPIVLPSSPFAAAFGMPTAPVFPTLDMLRRGDFGRW